MTMSRLPQFRQARRYAFGAHAFPDRTLPRTGANALAVGKSAPLPKPSADPEPGLARNRASRTGLSALPGPGRPSIASPSHVPCRGLVSLCHEEVYY